MDLPARLRQAVDAALDGASLAELTEASRRLSQRYRSEVRDGRFHVADELAAKAYLATRMPATYAAVRAAFGAIVTEQPAFAPRTLLDAGAGPGTVLWAAADAWPSLQRATLIEGSPAMRAYGERFAHACGVETAWTAGDVAAAIDADGAYDLVTLSFVLDELEEAHRDRLVTDLWARTSGLLVIVEPGRPGGWRRILRARDQLLAMNAHLVAPCPHAFRCPLAEPDWCHFAQRLPRSRLHRLAKGGDAPFEDEKFAYVAVSRDPRPLPAARILASPRQGSGKVLLKLCESDGRARERLITRREGAPYKAARRKDWGDSFDGPANT